MSANSRPKTVCRCKHTFDEHYRGIICLIFACDCAGFKFAGFRAENGSYVDAWQKMRVPLDGFLHRPLIEPGFAEVERTDAEREHEYVCLYWLERIELILQELE